MKRFVIVVDAQIDFMHQNGSLYVPNSEPLIPHINSYLANLTVEDTEGVLFTLDTHDSFSYPLSEEFNQFPAHCYKGTNGWRLAVDATKISRDIPTFKLEKNVFDMWAESHVQVREYDCRSIVTIPRDNFFGNISKDTLIEIIGVARDVCVYHAAMGFLNRGFKVQILNNLTKGLIPENNTYPIHNFLTFV